MSEYDQQLKRIKLKLIKAKVVDLRRKAFGARDHKYRFGRLIGDWKVQAFEKAYSIRLPECYRQFVLQVGNGGMFNGQSMAGPFYGIYPLGFDLEAVIEINPEKYLKEECVLYPNMSDEYWRSLTKVIDETDNISDQDYDKELGKIYGGVLPIGTQGCTFLTGIILNGPHKGRVIYYDMDLGKPFFTFENNFLDWYERWLNEVISGELLGEHPGWFGITNTGTPHDLLDKFLSSKNSKEKDDYLWSLLSKRKLSPDVLDRLEKLIPEQDAPEIMIESLCKSDYERAKPYLKQLLESNLTSFLKILCLYENNKIDDWIVLIKPLIHKIDEENYQAYFYLIMSCTHPCDDLIVPFLSHKNERIRSYAYSTLGEMKDKTQNLHLFIKGLQDESENVVINVLNVLEDVRDVQLLPHYKALAARITDVGSFFSRRLGKSLVPYGLNIKSIQKINIEEFRFKRWFEFWK